MGSSVNPLAKFTGGTTQESSAPLNPSRVGVRHTRPNPAIGPCCCAVIFALATVTMSVAGGCLWGFAGSNMAMQITGQVMIGIAGVDLLLMAIGCCCTSCVTICSERDKS